MKFLSKKLFKTICLAALSTLTAGLDAQTMNWSPAGPIYTAGRTRNMIVDKNDASGNTLYVGSTTSGIFKSTDGGANWAPLNDQGAVRNISYMAQAANGDIYVGTGEGFLRPSQAAKSQPGTGLYKLVGNALQLVASYTLTGTSINRVACSQIDANKIAIATNLGVLVSTDGGANFALANTGTFTPTPNVTVGQDVKFSGDGNLYFSVGPVTGATSVSSTLWKSTDGTLSAFNNVTPSSAQLASSVFGRIEIGIAPGNPNVVYASCAKKYVSKSSASLQGFFVSYDAANTWGLILVGSSQLDPLSNGGTIASGDYAHVVKVNPLNSNEVFLGGYNLFRFTRTGGSNSSPVGSWSQQGFHFAPNTQFYVHENIHDVQMIVSGGNITKYYIITDAGIYRSIDGLFTFQPFYKGLVTGQFNSVSIYRFPNTTPTPSAAAGSTLSPSQTYIGGTGGNGLTYFSGKFPLVSQELSYESGDIFNAEFSKILPKAAYFSSSTGALYRVADITSGPSDAVSFVQNTKTQNVQTLSNSTYTVAGTPFRLWENYEHVVKSPDSLVFYNDTAIARSAITSLTASTQFSFSVGRPQSSAHIDKIVIRTTTVAIASTPSQVAVSGFGAAANTKTLTIYMSPTYTVPAPTVTVPTPAPIASVEGFTNATPLVSNSVTLNSSTNLDNIYVTIASPVFTSNPGSSPNTGTNVVNYIRMQATVYYRYAPNATIQLVDNSISTITSSLTITTPSTGLSWSTTNPVLKLKQPLSARLAIPYTSGISSTSPHSIRVSNAPLDLNTPLSFVTVSQSGCLTTDANGAPTTNTISIVGKPTILEWSKSGTELYYATDANKLYRISYLHALVDSTSKGYGGKLHTNVFSYSNTPAPNTPNPRSPYRTTLIGDFTKKITSIGIPKNDSTGLVLTFENNTGAAADTLVMVSGDYKKKDISNIVWTNATSTLVSSYNSYSSLVEKTNDKRVFIGTDNGLYYTDDITQGTNVIWKDVNDGVPTAQMFPKVQIFDIKQQTMERFEAYNSGQIYVATNGRGIWTNSSYFVPTVVSVEETEAKATYENNLLLYPNPTNGNVNLMFSSVEGETAKISVIDINGRVVKSENLGKLYGDVNYTFNTSELSTGMYIVNVTSDSGIKRVTKLIVTK